MSQVVQVVPESDHDKQVCERSVDRISNLPSSVITEHILILSPVQEATRISILSKSWRYEWLQIRQLILDQPFFNSLEMGLISRTSVGIQEYINIINNVVFRHVGPIRKFSLFVPDWVPTSANVNINQWIQFVSDNGTVKEFSLQDSRCSSPGLPTSLFSCLSLTHLTFSTSSFFSPLPPAFTGFPCIISLHLDLLRGTDANSLESLISSCSQLEKLNLCLCQNGVSTTIRVRAPKLHDLVVGGYFSNVKLEQETTQINSLLVEGKWLCKRRLSELFSCLHNVETVVLDLIWKVPHSEYIPKVTNKLEQLKTLKLVGPPLNCLWASPLALTIIENSPRLQHLEIEDTLSCDVEGLCENMELCIPENLSYQCLKHVALVRILGTSHDLQFIKLLLACSPALEVMTIEFDKRMRVEENLDIAMELMRFHPRASENAQIIFKEWDE